MKKKIALILAAACIASTAPITAMAATDNYISSDKAVKAGAVLTGSNAPLLTIESSEDMAGDMYFMLNLNNAEWLYENSGTLPGMSGVTYTVLSSTMLSVEVDSSVFDATSSDIVIPLYTEVISQGTATVTIDPRDSGVSEGSYNFAHVNFPGMTVNVSSVDNKKGTFDINFKDDYPYQMLSTRLFKVTITNGFVFKSFESAEGTGKYKGIVNFNIDSRDGSTAYVELTNTSTISSGTMTIKGVQVSSTSKTEEGISSYLTIEPIYGEGSAIKYELQNFVSQEAEKEYKTIKFSIGGNYYVVDEDEMFPIDAAPFIDSNERTMLPLRALANAFDIADEDIIWNDSLKSVVITNKLGQKIEVIVGSNAILVDGAMRTMDTAAVIKDGRTYLPVRAVLNAMGVSDEDIDWNTTEKTITVDYK